MGYDYELAESLAKYFGLVLQVNERASSETLKREWRALQGRLQLEMSEKLRSDARGFVMEGNLPLQWVVDEQMNVVAAVRMPSETLLPNVGEQLETVMRLSSAACYGGAGFGEGGKGAGAACA